VQVERERSKEQASHGSGEPTPPPTAAPPFLVQHKTLVTAASGLLLLVIISGVGFYGYSYVRKSGIETEQQNIKDQYANLLNEAESFIMAGRPLAAEDSLSRALALPAIFDKSQARIVLREIKTVEAPADALVESFSDAEIETICRTGSLPPAYRLTYPPLDEQYRNKVLLLCYSERDKRRTLVEAHEKANQGRKSVAGNDQREAEKANGGTKDQPQSVNASVAEAVNMPAKVKLANGHSVSGVIKGCQGCEIKMVLTLLEDNPSATMERNYQCAEIIAIDFASRDSALQYRIVKAALVVGNGGLAYAIACTMTDDVRMKALSDNLDFAKAVADVKTAQAAYRPLENRVTECEAQVAQLDKQMISTIGSAKGGAAKGQQDSLSRERNSFQSQLPHLRAQRDAAKTNCEKAQMALTALCQDVLGKVCPN